MKRFNFFRITFVSGLLLVFWWNDVYMSSNRNTEEPKKLDQIQYRDTTNQKESYFANS